MGWTIEKDHLWEETDSIPSRVGVSAGKLANGYHGAAPFKFRILDDDGIVYYSGTAYDHGEFDEDEGSLYGALQWAAHDAGATSLETWTADGWQAVFG